MSVDGHVQASAGRAICDSAAVEKGMETNFRIPPGCDRARNNFRRYDG